MRGVPRSPHRTRGAGRLLAAACACLAASLALPAPAAEPAEAPPRLVSAIVQKSPTRSRLTIAFAPAPAATGYNLQASKALTFTRLVVDASSEGSPFTDVVVTPGVYFVRLRALGPGGPGPFGPVEVVNALASGLQILDRGGGARTTQAGASPGEAVATASSDSPAAIPAPPASTGAVAPPVTSIPTTPASSPEPLAESSASSPAMAPPVTPPPVQPGGEALADSEPSTTIVATAGIDAPAVRPEPEAVDPASAIPPPISEQDLAALGPLRVRYEALRSDLQQIEALRQALAASATTVLRQLAGTRDARESAELVNELSALQAARREIDSEIERNLLELGRILARAPAGP